MFWVKLRLTVCTWDPAHGKPYASAQLELSFGVEEGGWGLFLHRLCRDGAWETWAVSLSLFYRVISGETCCTHSGFVEQQDVALCDANAEVKGHQDLFHLTSLMSLCEDRVLCNILQSRISLLSGWLCYPSAPPFFPPPRLISPYVPREGEGSGENFCAAGGDRLSVPSTYTNGRISAPHKNN